MILRKDTSESKESSSMYWKVGHPQEEAAVSEFWFFGVHALQKTLGNDETSTKTSSSYTLRSFHSTVSHFDVTCRCTYSGSYPSGWYFNSRCVHELMRPWLRPTTHFAVCDYKVFFFKVWFTSFWVEKVLLEINGKTQNWWPFRRSS